MRLPRNEEFNVLVFIYPYLTKFDGRSFKVQPYKPWQYHTKHK